MSQSVFIEPYNSDWPNRYNEFLEQIVKHTGTSIQRIDHIGSTAVVGLAAKPIIDIQISVMDLDHIEEIVTGLDAIGFDLQKDNDDLSKRFFRERPGMRRTHIHVRKAGSWSEQFNLLFRDFLRQDEVERSRYAQIKYELADKFKDQRDLYTEGKTQVIFEIMLKANKWSQETGWRPGKAE